MSRYSGHLRRSVGGLLVALPVAVGLSLAAQQPAPTTALADRPLAPPKVRVNRTVPQVAPPRTTFAFSDRPTAAEIFAARAFGEPLVPVGGVPSDAETAALSRALLAYTQGATTGSVEPLRAFLAQHPGTAWRASLQLNLGVRYRAAGAYARALTSWDDAWQLARQGTDTHPRAVADLALAEWLLLNASLGQTQRVTERVSELDGRQVRGPAAVKIQEARELVAIITRYPDKVVSSGPSALQVILEEQKRPVSTALAQYRPTAAGTSLLQLRDLSRAANLPVRMMRRDGATEIPIPSVVHWSVGHYSAIVEQQGEQFRIVDRGMGGTYWMDRATLLEETSGYFLVAEPRASQPAGGLHSVGGWVDVDDATAATVVGHSCPPGGPPPNEPPDCEPCMGAAGGAGGGGGGGGGDRSGNRSYGMVSYQFHPVTASLRLIDTPVGYTPPRGPVIDFRLVYHQREQLQTQIPTSSHLGPKWMADWLRYLQEEPTDILGVNPPHVWVLLAGGGREVATGPSGGFYPTSWRTKATIVKVSETPLRYERRLPDGTVEVFAASDAAPAGQRRVYLTEIIDPQQQTVTLTWDAQYRMVAITDAIGQVTTLGHADAADPLRITSVTDPFGRAATFTYNALGLLETITDVIGMVSRMDYGAEDFVAALTTPYGTTSFRHQGPDSFTDRFIEAIDPLGGTEHLEFRWYTTDIPATEASTEVPTGFTAHNAGLSDSNTLYWDKLAWSRAPNDVTAATITRWLVKGELPTTPGFATGVAHSVKQALESRIWYAYPGQTAPWTAGTWSQPTLVGRVLDDGTSQISQKTHNAQGSVLTTTDPLGRQTTSSYAANGIDLLEVRQTTGGLNDLLATFANYAQHRPQTVTDAAGQVTTLTYNAAGQVLTATNAKNETTTNAYDSSGRLTSVTGPVSGATTTYTYDGYGRMRTVTDADNATVTTDYDPMDRPIRVTYPDTTYEETTYVRLDAASRRDRLGRLTRYYFDAGGRVVGTRDPLGRLVAQEWCACGSLEAFIDAAGNRTTWERDLRGRVMREIRADGVADTLHTYGPRSGRRLTVTDPKDQVMAYTYALDDQVLSTVFTNAVISTPSVTLTYDSSYGRVATMVDGTGTTTYGYHAPGGLGAGQIATVDGPLSNDTITYGYDEIGRATTRALNGSANTVTWVFDALARVTSEANVLGTFTYSYDGVTRRMAAVTYPNGQTSTYSHFPTNQDHQLQTIHHKYPGGATLSKFDYTYDTVGSIMTWRQQADTTAVLWEYRYDTADQLVAAVKKSTDPTPTVLKRYGYAYDPAGNRTAEQIDDQVTGASYDGLNRLMSGQPAGPLTFAGTVSEPAAVKVQGVPAVVGGDNSFRAAGAVASGTNTVTITATDASGNLATKQYEVTNAGTSKTFTYDANGNLTSDGTRTFEWDARNQLVAVNVGTHRSEFSYDGERRRVRVIEKENGVTQSDTKVVWCDQEICEERAADGTTITRRVFERGEQLAAATRFFVEDHLGSVEGVTDGASTVLTRYAFDPWGRRTVTAGSDTTSVGYTGHRWQSAGNVFLALYRAYDPELGRWLSEDPAGGADGLNLSLYVRGNPVTYSDELGLLRTVGFSGKDQKDVDEAIKRIKEKTECSNDCAGNQKEKLRRLLNDPGAILKFNPTLKECGKTGLATVLRLNKTFSIGPKAWNCCRNPVDPIDSLASTIAHELAHNGSGRHAYDMELKCFGCEGR